MTNPQPAQAPETAAAKQVAPVTAQVVQPAPSAADVARKVRRERARRLALGLAFWVGLPSLLGILYFGFVARSQYESVATLVLGGASDRSQLSATLLREHMLSRDTLDTLEREQKLSDHYTQRGDYFSRLADGAGSEARHHYFLDHTDVRYDTSTHVLTLRVRAFSGRDARRFAVALLHHGERFLEQALPGQSERLFVVASPSAPSDPTYPHRVRGAVTVFLASLALFAIGSLLVAAVREHAQF